MDSAVRFLISEGIHADTDQCVCKLGATHITVEVDQRQCLGCRIFW
ncbi:hypothetical protein BCO9919_07298 [Burkholderia cenocepacia]|uniref:Uncharacterized protein n=2 Tax=Burkholderia cepacia complex TaxID=87882 RepID=A0A6J5JUL2_9BURK|nr:hypothetical protein BCO9919_07298 [Burkholderia cenocepacia]VBB17334.1 hypothetical protein BSTAB16_7549 [Burkholderia stabilis]